MLINVRQRAEDQEQQGGACDGALDDGVTMLGEVGLESCHVSHVEALGTNLGHRRQVHGKRRRGAGGD